MLIILTGLKPSVLSVTLCRYVNSCYILCVLVLVLFRNAMEGGAGLGVVIDFVSHATSLFRRVEGIDHGFGLSIS